jgi:hypothetical protein
MRNALPISRFSVNLKRTGEPDDGLISADTQGDSQEELDADLDVEVAVVGAGITAALIADKIAEQGVQGERVG